MKFIRSFIIALLCIPLAAFAIEVEASIGNTTFTKPPNGQYWQNHNSSLGANSFDLNSPSYYIGLTGYASSAVRWRAGYLYLGNVTGVAKATSDRLYNGVDGCKTEPCDPSPSWWPTFTTESSARGFVLTLAPEFNIGGGLKAFVEGGVYIYQPKVDVMIDRCCSTGDYYFHYKSGWNAGPTVGLGLDYKGTQVVFSWYRIDAVNREGAAFENDIPPNFGSGLKDTFNVSLRQRF